MWLHWRPELLLLRDRGRRFSLDSSPSPASARGLHLAETRGVRKHAQRAVALATDWRQRAKGPGPPAARCCVGAVTDGREHGKRRARSRAGHVPRPVRALLARLQRGNAVRASTETQGGGGGRGARGARTAGRNAPPLGGLSTPRAACAGGTAASPPTPPQRACTARGRSSCPGPAHTRPTRRRSVRARGNLRAVRAVRAACGSCCRTLTFHDGLRAARMVATGFVKGELAPDLKSSWIFFFKKKQTPDENRAESASRRQ